MQSDVGEQRARVGEAARQGIDAQRGHVPAGLRRVRRAELLELTGKLLRGAGGRAFLEHRGGEVGKTGKLRIAASQSGVNNELNARDRQVRTFEVKDRQPIGKLERARR